ncbi:MAG: hypothetical protein C4518_08640 [Desulfobacteraceae bacterium]|nr:MAG: hypothetical protein C4518_08640 [Desulfobacteraceae bacterium]
MKKSEECVYCAGFATVTQTKMHEWTVSGILWKCEIELPVCKRCSREMIFTWADVPEQAEKLVKRK